MKIAKTDILADVLLKEHTLIPIISRLGIHLGIGNKTIDAVCKEYGLIVDFVVAILNATLTKGRSSFNNLHKHITLQTVEYIRRCHADFMHIQIKNIERHIKALNSSTDISALPLLFRLFDEYKDELSSLILKEEDMLSYVIDIYEVYFSPGYIPIKKEEFAGSLKVFNKEYEEVNEKLLDLESMLIKHLQGQYDENLFYAVILSLVRLQKDIQATRRIEEQILKPLVSDMEHEIKKRMAYTSKIDAGK